MLPLEGVISFSPSYSSTVQQPWTKEQCISQEKSNENMALYFVSHSFTFFHLFPLTSLFYPGSAGLSSLDPAELPQSGCTFRPEAAAAGGGIGGGAARGPRGVSAWRGAEGRVWETEGGDKADAEQPQGEGECLLLCILLMCISINIHMARLWWWLGSAHQRTQISFQCSICSVMVRFCKMGKLPIWCPLSRRYNLERDQKMPQCGYFKMFVF